MNLSPPSWTSKPTVPSSSRTKIDSLGGVIPESPGSKLVKIHWSSVSSAYITCPKKLQDLSHLTILTLDPQIDIPSTYLRCHWNLKTSVAFKTRLDRISCSFLAFQREFISSKTLVSRSKDWCLRTFRRSLCRELLPDVLDCPKLLSKYNVLESLRA